MANEIHTPFFERLDILLGDLENRVSFDNDYIGRKGDELLTRLKEIRFLAQNVASEETVGVEMSYSCSINNCVACNGATSGGVYYDLECPCDECEKVIEDCVANHDEFCEKCEVPHPSDKLLCPCKCH